MNKVEIFSRSWRIPVLLPIAPNKSAATSGKHLWDNENIGHQASRQTQGTLFISGLQIVKNISIVCWSELPSCSIKNMSARVNKIWNMTMSCILQTFDTQPWKLPELCNAIIFTEGLNDLIKYILSILLSQQQRKEITSVATVITVCFFDLAITSADNYVKFWKYLGT